MARPTLFTHRKFARLAVRLGCKFRALGVLEMMWHVAYQTGDPRVGTAPELEMAIGWMGKHGDCADALIDSGFVDVFDEELFIHDLADHCPDYVLDRFRKELERRGESITRNEVRERIRSLYPDRSGTGPGQARDESGTGPSRNRDESGTTPDRFRDTSGINPGQVQPVSLDCPGTPAPAPAPPIGRVCAQASDEAPPDPSSAQKRKRFRAPSLAELEDYMAESGHFIDAERFLAYYESIGWRVGKNPMKDWKAAVRHWAMRERGEERADIDRENAELKALFEGGS